jgi:AGZA family xanthine/uracil permease-like MFS transporter
VVLTVLVLTGFREAMMNAIPLSLKRAIGVGIGLFIALIGMVNAKFAVLGVPGAPLQAGTFHSAEAIVAFTGLVLTALLVARKIPGAIILGILASTTLAFALGVAKLPESIAAPSFANAFQADVLGALRLEYVPLLFALLMVDFFDTLGTVTAVADEAGLADKQGRIPGLRNILIVDSVSASIGGFLGASSVTCYIESAAGVAEGARTGLSSVFVGILFLLFIFLAPLAGIVPAAATAPALIIVGFLMCTQITRIDFTDLETAIPAFILLVTVPFTYSIAHGIGYGFIAFVIIKVLSGKFREVHLLMYGTASAFAAYFIVEAVRQ